MKSCQCYIGSEANEHGTDSATTKVVPGLERRPDYRVRLSGGSGLREFERGSVEVRSCLSGS